MDLPPATFSHSHSTFHVAIGGGEGKVQVRRPPGRVGHALPRLRAANLFAQAEQGGFHVEAVLRRQGQQCQGKLK